MTASVRECASDCVREIVSKSEGTNVCMTACTDEAVDD